MINKTFFTNFFSIVLFLLGYLLNLKAVMYCGLFAFSGAITNWLAIYMLFEKVPFLYGSGIIPLRFDEFKKSIKNLMLEEFFTKENIEKFIAAEMTSQPPISLKPIIEKTNIEPAFNALVEVVMNSSFGGMLAMFGGEESLAQLKDPFQIKMKESLIKISETKEFKQSISDELSSPEAFHDITDKIEGIIDARLDELTPSLVKNIIQKMIKKHLGWLVLWGGVFGGIIGFLSAFLI